MVERASAVEPALHQPVRHGERLAQILVRDVSERTPRRDARPPERFRLPHVPDPGDEALVEERVANGALLALGAQPPEHRVEVRREAEDVGPELRDPARVTRELEHRPVPEDGFVLVAAENEPRAPAAACAAGLDAPAAVHSQVAAQHEPALEAQQHVLPDRLHRLEAATAEPVREALRRRARMWRFHLHPLAGEHLQLQRRAMDRVTFRHATRVVASA